MTKLIFLDLDRRCLLLLKDIVDKTGAKIVVSSAWRRIPRAFQHLKEWLERYGIEVYDVTPYVGGERGNDITAWFNRNPGEYRYVILDDDSDMTTHMEHMVVADILEVIPTGTVVQVFQNPIKRFDSNADPVLRALGEVSIIRKSNENYLQYKPVELSQQSGLLSILCQASDEQERAVVAAWYSGR